MNRPSQSRAPSHRRRLEIMRDAEYFTRSFIAHSSLSTHHSSPAIIALALILFAAASQQTALAQYPVRWTKAVGPPSRRALWAMRRQPVDLPPGAEISYQDRPIRTCIDY